MSIRMLIMCAVMLMMLGGSSALAATFTVTNLDNDDAGSLRQAIIEANNNPGADTIEFQAGLTGRIELNTSGLTISGSLTINGPGINAIFISGEGLLNVFTITSGRVYINNLTITQGRGGVTVTSSVELLTMTDCVINSCLANNGGAISSESDVVLTDCFFIANSGVLNGGALFIDDAEGTVTNCVFSNNRAAIFGGAIYNLYRLKVDKCLFLRNTTGVNGGAIANSVIANITDCTFTDNIASRGGAISSQDRLTVTNSTFSSNAASEFGGGIVNAGDANVAHCTFFGNIATDGGAISNTKLTTLVNTLLAGSIGGNIHNTLTLISFGGNLDSDGTGFLSGPGDQSGTLAFPIDPKLGPLQDNGGPTKTHALLAGSPAIDAALLSDVLVDQRGVTRPQDADDDGVFLPDIGAYEIVSADLSISMSATPSPLKGQKAMLYTIVVHNYGPGSAEQVVVTDTLPYGAIFLSASATKNGNPLPSSVLKTPAVGNTGTVVANLGTLAYDTDDTVKIDVQVLLRKVTLTNTATVTSKTSDPLTSNNTVTVTTAVK